MSTEKKVKVLELKKQLEKQKKVISALKQRVKKNIQSTGSSFSIFERNILLEKEIDTVTRELKNSKIHYKSLYEDRSKELKIKNSTLKAEIDAHKKVVDKYKILFESAHDAIFLMKGNTFVDCNPQTLKMFGCTREQILNKKPYKFSPKKQPDGRASKDKAIDKITSALNGKPQFFEWQHSKLDGTLFDAEVSLNRIELDGDFFIQAIVRDITIRKKQEKIRRYIYRISRAVQTTTNMDEFYETIYKELNKIINIPNFLIGLYQKKSYFISVVYMKDEKKRLDEYSIKKTCSEQVIKKNRPLIFYDEDMIQLEKEGKLQRIGLKTKVWLGVPLRDGKDLVGIIILQSYHNKFDIDESHLELLEYISNQIALLIKRKQGEEKVKYLNFRNTMILDSVGDGIIGMDNKGKHMFVNPAAASMLGYSAKELMSKHGCSLWHHPHISHSDYIRNKCQILSVMDTKKSITNRTEMFWKKNGKSFPVEYTSTPIIEGNEITGVVVVFKDISEQLKLENKLVQVQKIESIGTLAGGVAHDFNNILTSIIGHAELMSQKLDDDNPFLKDIDSILFAGKRAAELTSQLLAFSRKQVYNPKVVDINQVLNNALKMQRRLISEDIKIVVNLSSNIPRVKADPVQLEQILMNLMVNARDAVNEAKRDDGEMKIIVEAGSEFLDDNYIQSHPGSHSGYFATISISDNGIGMDKQIRDKIFDPFFTTKEVGKGTGLGLATVYGIVKQNNGYINVYSEVGEGTAFKIYWPAIEDEDSLLFDKKEDSKILYGDETILIVEDDPAVRKFVISALKSLGYTVISAPNGKEALRIVSDGKVHINLLMTDIVMPGMNGEALAEKVKSIIPNINVLYTSGYAENHIVSKGMLNNNIHFIQKPYSIRLLSEKIRDVLLN